MFIFTKRLFRAISAAIISRMQNPTKLGRSFEPKKKSPALTLGLAVLFPGLGHVYLGDYTYRDVRIHNAQEGYRYQMPIDSFSDLATTPYLVERPQKTRGLGRVSRSSWCGNIEANSNSGFIFPLVAF